MPVSAPAYIPGDEYDAPGAVDELEVQLDSGPSSDMTSLPDGGIEVAMDGYGAPATDAPIEFGDNLAEFMQENELAQVGTQVREWVDEDITARKPWLDMLAEGLKLLGVVPDATVTGAMALAERVRHPVIAEAAVQFQARAMAELLPPTGPAKGMVLGEITKALEAQATRVADYLNYKLMVEDTDFYPESDQMLFTLAYAGSQFKKVYRDPLLKRTVSRWVKGEDFIVPYGASSLEAAPRYTHQQKVSQNDMRRMQRVGFYRDKQLSAPTDVIESNERLADAKDRAQGQEKGIGLSEDIEHTLYECHCYFDLPGFEDLDSDGSPSGIALPYIITIEHENNVVVGIRRNWKEPQEQENTQGALAPQTDEAATEGQFKRLGAFVHYPFLPGDGFYSYGFVHLIGGLAYGATGLMRIIMVGAAFASMQGGFRTKTGAKVPSNLQLEWGVYKEVDATFEEISKTFYTPPFKEPSEALFKILELIENAAKRFSSTTESLVGDASNTGPVGTTVALIEQGSKVHTGIHKRLHYAQGKELKLYAEVEAEYIPENGYPYQVHGADNRIARQDFDGRVDVLPVSDPNIFSSTQRIAIAQSVVQRADAHPELYDRKAVELHFLEAMRVPDAESFLVKMGELPRTDPVTENAFMIVGKGARTFPDQNHDAHMAVHQRTIDEFMVKPDGDPMKARVLPALLAHQAEHIAYGQRMKLMAQMQLPQPIPLDFNAQEGQTMTPELPPELDARMAAEAAMIIAKLPPVPSPAGDQQAADADAKLKEMQQAAEALAQQQKAIDQATNKSEKAKMQADHATQTNALQTKINEMRLQNERAGIQNEVTNQVKSALQEIEDKLAHHALDAKKEKMEQDAKDKAKAAAKPKAGTK